MDAGMYIIGFAIFTTYMGFTIWNILTSNQKQNAK